MKTTLFRTPSFLVIALATLALPTFAQTGSGSKALGGGLDYEATSYASAPDIKSHSISVAPSFFYFFQDNMAFGISLGIGSSVGRNGTAKNIHSSFALGPMFRYYKFLSDDRFAFFGQGSLTFGNTKSELANGTTTQSKSMALEVRPGLAWFFSEHWAAEFSVPLINFTSTDPDGSGDNNTNTFNFTVRTFSPTIGFRYHFGN